MKMEKFEVQFLDGEDEILEMSNLIVFDSKCLTCEQDLKVRNEILQLSNLIVFDSKCLSCVQSDLIIISLNTLMAEEAWYWGL